MEPGRGLKGPLCQLSGEQFDRFHTSVGRLLAREILFDTPRLRVVSDAKRSHDKIARLLGFTPEYQLLLPRLLVVNKVQAALHQLNKSLSYSLENGPSSERRLIICVRKVGG